MRTPHNGQWSGESEWSQHPACLGMDVSGNDIDRERAGNVQTQRATWGLHWESRAFMCHQAAFATTGLLCPTGAGVESPVRLRVRCLRASQRYQPQRYATRGSHLCTRQSPAKQESGSPPGDGLLLQGSLGRGQDNNPVKIN